MNSGASQAEIANGSGIARATQVDISQKFFDASSIVYNQINPNTFGQPIIINNSNSLTTFNIPAEVFSMGGSFLQYQVSIPIPVATNYIWWYADTVSEIQHIQFFTASNQLICDLDYLNNYYHVVWKKETALNEFLTMDPLGRFSPSGVLANQVPALRNSTVAATPSPSSVNYTEPAYFNVGALNAAVTYNVQLDFSRLKNTFLELDKMIYMPMLSYIKIFWAPVSKVCYMSTSNASPSAGTLNPWAPTTVGNTVQILNPTIFLAVETAKPIRAEVMNRVASGGMRMMIPWTFCYRNPVAGGTSQNINIPLDIGSGRSVRKIIHTVFSNAGTVAEALDAAYDCSNTAFGTTTNPQKVLSYYTSYNGTRIQNLNIDCLAADNLFQDYMIQRRNQKGSVMQNMNVFQYSWYHEDDFCGVGPEYTQNNNNELVSGIPLSGTPVTWQFNGAVMTNAAYNHYTYITFTKELNISPTIVEVS